MAWWKVYKTEAQQDLKRLKEANRDEVAGAFDVSKKIYGNEEAERE